MSNHTTGMGDRLSSSAAPLLTSGLDPESQFVQGETAEEFVQLQTQYFARFAPSTPEERFQVDNLIRNEWLLRRFFRVEAHLWEYHAMLADRSSGVQLGEAFTKASPIFMRLQRRITAAERAYKEAMGELKRLQAHPQPEQSKDETEQLGSFLSFLSAACEPPRPSGPNPPAPSPTSASLANRPVGVESKEQPDGDQRCTGRQ